MTTEDMIRALGNVIEEYKNKPVFTEQTNIPIMCRDVIDKLKELSNPWKTGTPTVKGDYLLCFPRRNEVAEHYEVAEFDGRDFVFATGMHQVVVRTSPLSVAWQKIEPYEFNAVPLEENPIEAFMRKQPCDKCLFQNTPNCKIFGIGVNGEMGCSFKERVRMSEIKEN